jgi:hypothetical protein
VKDPEANPVINFSGQETPINEGNTTNPESSGSLSPTELRPGGSGGSAGLGLQLKNRSSALPINSPSTSPSKDGDLERKLPGTPNGGNSSGGSSEGQSFGKWWPVCIFVDDHIVDANEQVKELVRMSAACQVNLQPYIKKVSILDPNNPDLLNQLQGQACDIKEAGIADRGSTLVITNQSDTVADKMCGSVDEKGKPTTDVAGCNEVAQGISGGARKLYDQQMGQKKHEMGSVAGSSVAVGIVDAGGFQNGKIWSHEAIGHGQMGWPNGKGAGNGIANGDNPKDNGGEDPSEGKEDYTGVGCARMQAQAIADPDRHHFYYPNKENYYSVWNLPVPLGTPMWGSGKGGPQTPDVAQKNSTAPPRGNDQNSSPPGSPSPLATAGPGHKKPLGQVSRGIQIRSGDANKESGRVAKRGGDDSPSEAGSAVDGKGTGEAFGNKTIVVNNDAQNSDGENPNSSSGDQKSDLFADSSKTGSGRSGLGGGSSEDSGFSGTPTASIMKNKKTRNGGLNDPDYLANSTPPETKEKEPKRKPARVGDAQVAGAGVKPNRTPASSTTNLNSTPSRALRNQVNFDGGV